MKRLDKMNYAATIKFLNHKSKRREEFNEFSVNLKEVLEKNF